MTELLRTVVVREKNHDDGLLNIGTLGMQHHAQVGDDPRQYLGLGSLQWAHLIFLECFVRITMGNIPSFVGVSRKRCYLPIGPLYPIFLRLVASPVKEAYFI